MYTSGTTGPSKGVLCPHRHAFASSVSYPPADDDDVVLVTLPLFHIGGLWKAVYNGLIAGATIVVAEQFSATNFWDTVRRFEVTTTFLLGAMADFLLLQPASELDTSHAESGYGLTESGTICLAGRGRARDGSCGWPRSSTFASSTPTTSRLRWAKSASWSSGRRSRGR